MRKIYFILLCLLPACLPTQSELVSCSTDQDCTAIGSGLICDKARGVCICANGFYPGCDQNRDDGGQGAGAAADVLVPAGEVGGQAAGVVDAEAVDGAAADAPTADAALDTRNVDAEGTCSESSDCPDRARGFCIANKCSACTAALCAALPSGPLVCASAGPSAGQCVECAGDVDCKNPAKAFCVANACTGCSTAGASGCTARTDGRTVCATVGPSVGQCVECAGDGDCKNPAKSFCVANACTGCATPGASGCAGRSDGKVLCASTGALAGQCVECLDDGQCTKEAGKGFCVANACTGCATVRASGCAARTDGKTACASTGVFAGQCVECVSDGHCSGDAARSFCVANVCSSCTTPGASGCVGRADGKTVCATAGEHIGQCVACVVDGQCTGDAGKGFCVANACTGCNTAGATGCSGRTDGKTSCATSGALAGQCVECVGNAQCTKDAAKGFCVQNACTGCQNAGASACSGTKPACASTGPLAGQCVECVGNGDCTANAAERFCVSNVCSGCDQVASNPCTGSTPVCAPGSTPSVGGQCVGCLTSSDCASATPFCDAYSCRTCRKNSECSGISPAAVCGLDGTCPGDSAVIYVQNSGTCPGSGTAASPYCFPNDAAAALSTAKAVIVVRGQVAPSTPLNFSFTGKHVLVAGQSSAEFRPVGVDTPVVSMSAGEITFRDVTVSGGLKAGVSVAGGAILHMDRCYVVNNTGTGILTDSSAFDIVNTVIASNGGSTSTGVTLGAYTGTGPKRFVFNTVVNNGVIGVTCGAAYSLTGILANGNGTANFSANCTIDSTTSTAAPAFGATPYHLSATSPCVNTGGRTNCPSYDIDGDTRPQGTNCDCGADEYKP